LGGDGERAGEGEGEDVLEDEVHGEEHVSLEDAGHGRDGVGFLFDGEFLQFRAAGRAVVSCAC
jgi:hypothetical protein